MIYSIYSLWSIGRDTAEEEIQDGQLVGGGSNDVVFHLYVGST